MEKLAKNNGRIVSIIALQLIVGVMVLIASGVDIVKLITTGGAVDAHVSFHTSGSIAGILIIVLFVLLMLVIIYYFILLIKGIYLSLTNLGSISGILSLVGYGLIIVGEVLMVHVSIISVLLVLLSLGVLKFAQVKIMKS